MLFCYCDYAYLRKSAIGRTDVRSHMLKNVPTYGQRKDSSECPRQIILRLSSTSEHRLWSSKLSFGCCSIFLETPRFEYRDKQFHHD